MAILVLLVQPVILSLSEVRLNHFNMVFSLIRQRVLVKWGKPGIGADGGLWALRR